MQGEDNTFLPARRPRRAGHSTSGEEEEHWSALKGEGKRLKSPWVLCPERGQGIKMQLIKGKTLSSTWIFRQILYLGSCKSLKTLCQALYLLCISLCLISCPKSTHYGYTVYARLSTCVVMVR